MSSHTDEIDQQDLANIRSVRDLFSHVDPVPAGLTERVKFAITVQALHAEVAELIDSAQLAVRGAELVPSTEPAPTESVTFTAAAVSIMITVSPMDDPARVNVDGWVTQTPAEVDAVSTEGTVTVNTDDNGRFVVDNLPRGPIHFVIRLTGPGASGRPVITPTMEL